jgi:hypothetical protein
MSTPVADDFVAIAARRREIFVAEKGPEDPTVANGAALDKWASIYGIPSRRFDESDAELRLRILKQMEAGL